MNIYTGHNLLKLFINKLGLFSSLQQNLSMHLYAVCNKDVFVNAKLVLLYLAVCASCNFEQKVESAICTSDHKVVCLRSVGWGWAEVSMVSS